jgi:hypothetical protein
MYSMSQTQWVDVEEGKGLVALEELHCRDLTLDDLAENARGCHVDVFLSSIPNINGLATKTNLIHFCTCRKRGVGGMTTSVPGFTLVRVNFNLCSFSSYLLCTTTTTAWMASAGGPRHHIIRR